MPSQLDRITRSPAAAVPLPRLRWTTLHGVPGTCAAVGGGLFVYARRNDLAGGYTASVRRPGALPVAMATRRTLGAAKAWAAEWFTRRQEREVARA